MSIDSYQPQPSDVKQTVEKQVKARPKIKELTKIESPGRPVEADNLEEKPKNRFIKKSPKLKSTQNNVSITQPKKDSVLIITEKPQAALKISSALSTSARKYSENNVPYYELEKDKEKIIVASAVGHLFNLTYEKGQTGWPIFKTIWIPSYENKSASFTKNYLNLLKKLVKRAKEIIIATDYDVEGEVIGWNVLRFIAQKDTAKRMKYSTLTKEELVKAYEKPLPTLDWPQAYAGETRHLLDWLYGINLSRALMSAIKKTGSFRILSIGRVQGPALKIIVERDKEIASFKPEPYWQVIALTDSSKDTEFKHNKDIFNKNELEIFKDIKEAEAKTIKKEEIIRPPHPFDLTTLQREAYAKLRLSPSRTLQVAQSLYLDGIISYPRTSSQKIPPEINPKDILKKLSQKFPETKKASRVTPVEGEKTDPAHPSIYPTGEFKQLDGDEKKLYELIVKRFISCFCNDARTANKKVVLTSKEKDFIAYGLSVLERGWTEVYPSVMEEKELSDLNGKVKINKMEFVEKETQPPKRYTPASLVSLLEKKNLGTKATRSMIVDTLFDRGYLDGKSIQATPLGIKLIESLEKFSPIIINEDLTRKIEEKLESMQGTPEVLKEKEKEIIENAEKIILDISKDFKAHEIEIGKELMTGTQELREQQKENNILMKCPVCQQGQLVIKFSKATKRQFVACDKYPECKTTFSLPPNSLIKKTDKLSERNLPILIAIRKGKRPWEFEFNPNWKSENPNYEKKS